MIDPDEISTLFDWADMRIWKVARIEKEHGNLSDEDIKSLIERGEHMAEAIGFLMRFYLTVETIAQETQAELSGVCDG